MTSPGAPDSALQPQPHVPDAWPPQQQVGPAWPVPPQFPGQPPLRPRADSTRTIAIVALVVSGVTLLGTGATDPAWYGIVRFSGSDGSFDVLTMGGPDGSFGPNAPDGPTS